MQTITITPDFDHPLELHTPEYEEVYDPEGGVLKIVLVAGADFTTRWARAVTGPRSLEECVRISARTTECLLTYGMDLVEDSKEQRKWAEENPYKKHGQEINRLPAGTPPIEIFKIMQSVMRNDVLVNIPAKYKLTDGIYKTIINEHGEPVKAPLMDVDLTFNGKEIKIPATVNRNTIKRSATQNAKVPLPPPDIYTSAVGAKLSALLNEYDKQVVQDATQLRTYITNRLLEISKCGTPKDELRALELLGKISDIGLFVEKSEINVTHTTSAALEHSIKDKINRLLGKAEVDISDADYRPLPKSLVPASLRTIDQDMEGQDGDA
jgi:hypothetical protein